MSERKVLILLSDTDPLLARVYRNKFKKNDGWDASITESYDEAKRIIEAEKPELILSDIILNNGDGLQLLRDVRKSNIPDIVNTPFVILTDLGQPEDKKIAEHYGVTLYLVKSEVTINDVVDKIKEMLG